MDTHICDKDADVVRAQDPAGNGSSGDEVSALRGAGGLVGCQRRRAHRAHFVAVLRCNAMLLADNDLAITPR